MITTVLKVISAPYLVINIKPISLSYGADIRLLVANITFVAAKITFKSGCDQFLSGQDKFFVAKIAPALAEMTF